MVAAPGGQGVDAVETVEPADCQHFLPARHHRGVGAGNAELATSAGLPRPEIHERGDCVTVCFRHGQTGRAVEPPDTYGRVCLSRVNETPMSLGGLIGVH